MDTMVYIYILDLESSWPVIIPSYPTTSLWVILGEMPLSAFPVKIVVLIRSLIIMAPVIKMLIPVLVILVVITIPVTIVVKPVTIISKLVMVKTIIVGICTAIATIPATVKCYAIIPGTVIIVVHKWPVCTHFKPA